MDNVKDKIKKMIMMKELIVLEILGTTFFLSETTLVFCATFFVHFRKEINIVFRTLYGPEINY